MRYQINKAMGTREIDMNLHRDNANDSIRTFWNRLTTLPDSGSKRFFACAVSMILNHPGEHPIPIFLYN